MTEMDIATTIDSDAPTLYLGFSNVMHRGDAWLDTLGEVTLDSGEKPFADAHHLVAALAPYPTLQIMLTTSWSWWRGDAEVIALLPRALRKRVVGTTREFPPRIEEAVTGRGFAGSIIRHVIAHRLTNWLAIGSNFSGVPSCLASHFLALSASGLEDSGNREALLASLALNFKRRGD
jgi:hypothetical protein